MEVEVIEEADDDYALTDCWPGGIEDDSEDTAEEQ